MVTVNMELPDEMIAYAMPEDKERQLIRNAMMLYPYILEKGFLMEGQRKYWEFISWI